MQKLIVVIVLHVACFSFAVAQLFLSSVLSPRVATALALTCALAKSAAYAAFLRRNIVRVRTASSFHDFLLLLCGAMFAIIASYGCDFFVLQSLNEGALTAAGTEPLELLFNCWYFSLLNFSFFGVSDIVPSMFAARVLLSLETVTGFLTAVFVLSDFVALRDSMAHARLPTTSRT